MKVTDIAKGQTFHHFGVDYMMVRVAGECVQPIRNQWGRAGGGTYVADKIAVRVHKGPSRGGWSAVHYTAFHKTANGVVFDEVCSLEGCAWKYPSKD